MYLSGFLDTLTFFVNNNFKNENSRNVLLVTWLFGCETIKLLFLHLKWQTKTNIYYKTICIKHDNRYNFVLGSWSHVALSPFKWEAKSSQDLLVEWAGMLLLWRNKNHRQTGPWAAVCHPTILYTWHSWKDTGKAR